MNLSFLLPKTRRDFAAAGRRLARFEERGAWSVERGGEEILTTIERQGGREKEQPKVGPKGEGVGTTESKDTEGTEEDEACLDKPSGDAFSNPSTSELARDSENSSLTRSASGPASPATSYSLPATAPEVPLLDSAAALDGEPLRGGSRTEQPRHWEMPRKHIEYGPKGAASRERARQSPSLQGGTKAPGAGELAELQLGRIREVWRDAVADVPYYGRLVAEGRAPSEIRSWEDFFSIPELTREILQDCQGEFVRRSGPPDMWRMTGGSTGNPVKFGVWTSEDEVIRVLKLVLWRRLGYRPSDRLFLIWGHSHLLGTGWRRHWNHFLRKGKDALLGYKRVDAYALSEELCERYAGELLRYRPAGLIGYSAALDYFVRALPERWGEFRALGLKFVMPCAEPAPREDSFELLGRVFGCPVIQEFGGVDFGHVGMKLGDEPFVVFGEENFVEAESGELGEGSLERAEGSFEPLITQIYTDKDKEAGPSLAGQAGASESDSLPSKLADSPVSESLIRSADGPAGARVAPDDRRLKIEVGEANLPATSYPLPATAPEARALDAGRVRQWNAEHIPTGSTLDSPAEQGAALVTSLYRRYLPLIRYRQGDVLGGVGMLAHGHVASFERLQGRVNDMVVLEDGTAVHSVAVFHCTHQEPAVLNIQMVLENAGPRILLVTRGGIDAGLEGRIRHRLGQIAPALAEARMERVEDLVTTRAGKRRWVVDRRGAKRQEIDPVK